jgi:hypothetical protein
MLCNVFVPSRITPTMKTCVTYRRYSFSTVIAHHLRRIDSGRLRGIPESGSF